MGGLEYFQGRAGCYPTAIFNQYQEYIVALGNCMSNAALTRKRSAAAVERPGYNRVAQIGES